MAVPWTPIIEGAAALGGAALNYFGARKANKANLQAAREQMDFQKKTSEEQMGFQERMSNTSYQRAMQDMREGGINPIMAYNMGGASTPAGAMGAGAMARQENEMAPFVNSALEMRRMRADIARVNADTEYLKELKEALKFQNVGNEVESKIDEGTLGYIARVAQRFNPMARWMK